jgi:hypothetical protein
MDGPNLFNAFDISPILREAKTMPSDTKREKMNEQKDRIVKMNCIDESDLNRVGKLSDPTSPSHYTGQAIEPIEYIAANKLDFCEGNVVKYITRWKHKNGIEDLEKARVYIDFLINMVKNGHPKKTSR